MLSNLSCADIIRLAESLESSLMLRACFWTGKKLTASRARLRVVRLQPQKRSAITSNPSTTIGLRGELIEWIGPEE